MSKIWRRMEWLRAVVVAVICAQWMASAAIAQNYPLKPLRIVVDFSASR